MRAVNSVLLQTHKEIELIIVDDNEEDSAYRKEIERYIKTMNDSRIEYIKHKKNMGACAARNTGIKAAKGEFITFLDDDDEWLPQKLEKQIPLMSNPEVGLVYCGYIDVDDVTGIERVAERKTFEGWVFDELIKENFIGSTSFPLIRKSVFEDAGFFDIEAKSAQDYDMWLRISKKYVIKYLNEVLVKYHVHSGAQISKNPQNVVSGLERLNKKYEDYLNTHRKARSIRVVKIVPYYIKNGQRAKAIKTFFLAIFLNPFNVRWNCIGLYSILFK
jgi:glycosyltransferase involved in cell wall biosynthesis